MSPARPGTRPPATGPTATTPTSACRPTSALGRSSCRAPEEATTGYLVPAAGRLAGDSSLLGPRSLPGGALRGWCLLGWCLLGRGSLLGRHLGRGGLLGWGQACPALGRYRRARAPGGTPAPASGRAAGRVGFGPAASISQKLGCPLQGERLDAVAPAK